MKQDSTVWISLVMIVIPGLTGYLTGMPQHITSDDPFAYQLFFWLMFLGAIRATVLWFQTLIHGVQHAKEENRVAAVLGHLFLGPVMSYLYYFDSQDSAERSN